MPILIIAISLITPSCEKVNELCTGDDCFSYDTFAENIKERVGGEAVGYGFIIYHNGNTNNFYTEGLRITAADGQELFTLTNELHIASISKTISTMALMRLLENKGISVDAPMHTYLPSDWAKGSNVTSITFRNLVTHNSGFRSGGNGSANSYANLKTMVANGVSLADKAQYSYANVNFGLLRILIPRINGYSPSFAGSIEQGYANAYVSYVQTTVMAKAAIPTKDCKPEANPTLCYTYPDNGANGWNTGDLTLNSGAFGWYLSIADLGNILTKFMHTEEIVSNSARNKMFVGQLGCFQRSGDRGTYYWHNGGWGNGAGQGLNTCYMLFPEHDTHVVLFMNSTPQPEFLPTLLKEAYDDAWGVL